MNKGEEPTRRNGLWDHPDRTFSKFVDLLSEISGFYRPSSCRLCTAVIFGWPLLENHVKSSINTFLVSGGNYCILGSQPRTGRGVLIEIRAEGPRSCIICLDSLAANDSMEGMGHLPARLSSEELVHV